MGPMAMPSPVVPVQMPIARSWSSGSRKRSVMIERVAGMMQAAPKPMKARKAISSLTEPEKADPADPAAKRTRPAQKTFLRPTRSPTLPITRRNPANTHE